MEKKKKGVIAEFKEFISRGSVLDMAVGIIIGTSFTAIVNSLVADLFMPLLGMLTGEINFSQLKVVLKEEVVEGAEIIPEVAVGYGLFIEKIINFLLVAVAVFAMIKVLNTIREKAEALAQLAKKEAEEAEEEEEAIDPQLALLTEIRDLLKNSPDEE